MVLTHSNDEDSSPCTFSVCKADDDICLVRIFILSIQFSNFSRDENVDEYLRLSSCADRQQLSRIKQVTIRIISIIIFMVLMLVIIAMSSSLIVFQVFEKKNQKSAQSIAQLQKKLETYQRKVKNAKRILFK